MNSIAINGIGRIGKSSLVCILPEILISNMSMN